MPSSQSQASILDTTLTSAVKVAKLCLAALIICTIPAFIGVSLYALVKSSALQGMCSGVEHVCGLAGTSTTTTTVVASAESVVKRVDSNHDELLNSLSEKFQFVVDANKNTSAEVIAAILSQHNQTRHEHRVALDDVKSLQQQLLNMTLTQMKTVAQECPVSILAALYPRLDAIDATLRVRLDKETELQNALTEVKKLKANLKIAREAEADLKTQLHDPWSALCVMIALAICAVDDRDPSFAVRVTVFWVVYKLASFSGMLWPLAPSNVLGLFLVSGLLLVASVFARKRAADNAAEVDSAVMALAKQKLEQEASAAEIRRAKQNNLRWYVNSTSRRLVEDERPMPKRDDTDA